MELSNISFGFVKVFKFVPSIPWLFHTESSLGKVARLDCPSPTVLLQTGSYRTGIMFSWSSLGSSSRNFHADTNVRMLECESMSLPATL
jgi:hypothetical protein